MSVSYIRKVSPVAQPAARPCTACGGSGHYDATGSPPCDACRGTGAEVTPRAAGPKTLSSHGRVSV